MSHLRVPAAGCRRGPHRGRDRRVEGRARRHRRRSTRCSSRSRPRSRSSSCRRRSRASSTAMLVEEGATVDGRHADHLGDDRRRDAAPATGAPAAAAPPRRRAPSDAPSPTPRRASRRTRSRGAVLVGYGLKGGRVASRRRRAAADAAAPRPAAPPAAVAPPVAAASACIAKPPIRKLAKDLGVDLATVTATGLAGEVTRDDVIRQASQASVFRNIQTPEWARRARGAHPGQGRAQGDRDRDGVERVHARRTSACSSTSTRPARWSSSSGSRPRPTSPASRCRRC